MLDSEYNSELAECCKSLYEKGIKQLSWSANPASLDSPWAEGWADVYLPKICDELDLNWLATIVSPSDNMDEGPGYFKVPHDAELVFEFAEVDRLSATKKTFLRQGYRPKEIPLVVEEDSDGNTFYWAMYRRADLLDPEADVETYVLPVWSIQKIEETISDWLFDISGIRFDLVFDPEDESPLHAKVRQTIEEIAAGKAETFDLGDGLSASSDAFDSLLQDPEMSAELVSWLKEIKKDLN